MTVFTLAVAYVMLETFKLIINAPVNMLLSKLWCSRQRRCANSFFFLEALSSNKAVENKF